MSFVYAKTVKYLWLIEAPKKTPLATVYMVVFLTLSEPWGLPYTSDLLRHQCKSLVLVHVFQRENYSSINIAFKIEK